MEGYPKDTSQAATFVNMIGPPNSVIHLDVPAAVMNGRLPLRNNFDDTPESICKRVDKFTNVTLPLIRKWNGIRINACQDVHTVFKDVKEALKQEGLFEEIELNVAIK